MNLEEKLAHLSTGRAAIIGMVIAGMYFAFWYDNGEKLETQITSVKESIKVSEIELNRIQKAIEDAKKYQKISEELGEKMELVLKYIPEELRISDLMKMLSTEAKAVGANILSVKDVAGAKQRDFFEEIAVELKIEADFTQILLFLSYMTRVERIITLNHFSIDGNKKAAGPNERQILSFIGNFSGYRYLGQNAKSEKGGKKKN